MAEVAPAEDRERDEREARRLLWALELAPGAVLVQPRLEARVRSLADRLEARGDRATAAALRRALRA